MKFEVFNIRLRYASLNKLLISHIDGTYFDNFVIYINKITFIKTRNQTELVVDKSKVVPLSVTRCISSSTSLT